MCVACIDSPWCHLVLKGEARTKQLHLGTTCTPIVVSTLALLTELLKVTFQLFLLTCWFEWNDVLCENLKRLWIWIRSISDHQAIAIVNYIENTRRVSFDIKFTMQGFENACWHREACRAIQHAFSKPSLVNLKSKVAKLVFYLSVYPLMNTLQTSDYDVIFYFCVDSES